MAPDSETVAELLLRGLHPPPVDRPAINPTVGYHRYRESEFPAGIGHCDECGGGPGAEIHQKPVDQLGRIADALERIAEAMDGETIGYELGRIADFIKEIRQS